jgi:hypothetical protein
LHLILKRRGENEVAEGEVFVVRWAGGVEECVQAEEEGEWGDELVLLTRVSTVPHSGTCRNADQDGRERASPTHLVLAHTGSRGRLCRLDCFIPSSTKLGRLVQLSDLQPPLACVRNITPYMQLQ